MHPPQDGRWVTRPAERARLSAVRNCACAGRPARPHRPCGAENGKSRRSDTAPSARPARPPFYGKYSGIPHCSPMFHRETGTCRPCRRHGGHPFCVGEEKSYPGLQARGHITRRRPAGRTTCADCKRRDRRWCAARKIRCGWCPPQWKNRIAGGRPPTAPIWPGVVPRRSSASEKRRRLPRSAWREGRPCQSPAKASAGKSAACGRKRR